MASSCKLSKHGSEPMKDGSFYRSIAGALQYVTVTHPELSYSLNKVFQFMSSPLESHWTAVKRILRYLNGHLHHGLVFRPAPLLEHFVILIGFSSLDYINPSPLEHFVILIGQLTLMTEGLLLVLQFIMVPIWFLGGLESKRCSLDEAEYKSLATATANILWI